jgi:hypothetical protein
VGVVFRGHHERPLRSRAGEGEGVKAESRKKDLKTISKRLYQHQSRTAGQLARLSANAGDVTVCFSCLSPNWTVPKTERSVSGVGEAGAKRSGVRSGLESGSPLAAVGCGIYSEGPARSRA